ncbi:MAG: hypothetical protein SFU98_17925 [Leptospiraceae bacterium]|nr:hypothetical protein [Leptospiraceae bacterium]
MKIHLITIMILSLLGTKLASEEKTNQEKQTSQGKLRNLKKIMISSSITRTREHMNPAQIINFQYNMNKYLSFNVRFIHHYYKDYSVNYILDQSVSAITNNKKELEEIHTIGSLKYYPSSSFFYIGLGLGRDSGKKISSTRVYNFENNGMDFYSFKGINTFTTTIDPYYYFLLQYGLEYQFPNGIFLGIELNGTVNTPNTPRPNSNSNLSILESGNRFTPSSIYLIQLSEINNLRYFNHSRGIYIHFGYSF